MPKLNEEQEVAVAEMLRHTNTIDPYQFMVLEGPAGTGKTTTVRAVIERQPSLRYLIVAPTNKAVKVIREMVQDLPYEITVVTIYSALGLQMQTNGEVKEIGYRAEAPDLTNFDVIICDEAGMLNRPMVQVHIAKACKRYPMLRWIFMGDRWQLPPVGEKLSEIWSIPHRAVLRRVMRTDNQILTFATHVRNAIPVDGPLSFKDDYDERGGVHSLGGKLFQQALVADPDAFRRGDSKAVAWRNDTVNAMNMVIRRSLLADPDLSPWQEGERVTLLEPAKDLNDEIVAHTDDDGTIMHVQLAQHPHYKEFRAYRMAVEMESGGATTLWALHPDERAAMEKRKAHLAEAAKTNRSEWYQYWRFMEAFHKVRHGYATTAHRAQGSTYTRAYVNWRDIMVNRDREEALRCLYVGVSRPKLELYLG